MANDGKPTLSVDFDGVLHLYVSGWKGAEIITDPPVPGAMIFLERAAKHFHVCIYSSRSSDPAGLLAMQRWLRFWAREECGSGALDWIDDIGWPITKPPAFLTIDDRCIQFRGVFPRHPEDLLKYRPWNKPDARVIEPARLNFDGLRELIAANENAHLEPSEPDESDISVPPSGLTMGMIRRARREFELLTDMFRRQS